MENTPDIFIQLMCNRRKRKRTHLRCCNASSVTRRQDRLVSRSERPRLWFVVATHIENHGTCTHHRSVINALTRKRDSATQLTLPGSVSSDGSG